MPTSVTELEGSSFFESAEAAEPSTAIMLEFNLQILILLSVAKLRK
jgi:hypothetical protein